MTYQIGIRPLQAPLKGVTIHPPVKREKEEFKPAVITNERKARLIGNKKVSDKPLIAVGHVEEEGRKTELV